MRGGLLFCPNCKSYFGTPAIFKEYVDNTPPKIKIRHSFIICPCGHHKMLIESEATNKFTHKNVFWMSIKPCNLFDFNNDHYKSFRGIPLTLCSEDDPNLYIVDYTQKNLPKNDFFFKPLVKK